MSNIDKLKAAAAKAVDNFDPNMFVETRDVLALLDELEAKDKQISLDFQIKARLCRESNSLHDRLREAEKRIAELEATEAVVNIKPPTIGRAYSVLNHVWTEQEVRKACELAGIKLNIAAAGKGE